MMTRKDLYRVADALAETKPLVGSFGWNQWLRDVRAVADALEVTMGFTTNGNRSFSREQFYAACGIEKEGS